jgi:hypothetical protein
MTIQQATKTALECQDAKSWKAGVKTPGDHEWVYNALRFKTKEEAEAYVLDLSMRWTAVQEVHVEPSDEEPNR